MKIDVIKADDKIEVREIKKGRGRPRKEYTKHICIADKEYIEAMIKNGVAKGLRRHINNKVFFEGLLIALMHGKVIKIINRKPGQPLRGLSNAQINILLGGYALSKIKYNVFNKNDLLIFAPDYYKNAFRIYNDINLLIELNFFETIDELTYFKRTRKTLKPRKTVGRQLLNYGVTYEGQTAIKEYLNLFEKAYNKINSGVIMHDFSKLQGD